jgi:hypothetical protein
MNQLLQKIKDLVILRHFWTYKLSKWKKIFDILLSQWKIEISEYGTIINKSHLNKEKKTYKDWFSSSNWCSDNIPNKWSLDYDRLTNFSTHPVSTVINLVMEEYKLINFLKENEINDEYVLE